MLWNEFRLAISWATSLSTLRLNRTRNELVNNSLEDVDDVTCASINTKSPKSRAHHFTGIFCFGSKLRWHARQEFDGRSLDCLLDWTLVRLSHQFYQLTSVANPLNKLNLIRWNEQQFLFSHRSFSRWDDEKNFSFRSFFIFGINR